MIGKTLAHYEITALLGKGGMGEVYRARDTKLDREVALKLLPATLSSDPERGARFEREARVLASLQHPNIATLYGFERADGARFLTMELADGQDLAQVLLRGPIPREDAVGIAAQIALGLEAAHQKGVIHRDLKPANVKVDSSGNVKILDFGLARAYVAEPLEGEDLANSPTITAAMTQAGVILGTAAYMSPEQAKGKAVDQRSDIWSYGVLVFEMLSGKRLFAGETISETMAEVMKGDIDWKSLPDDTPAWLTRLLRRCLDRDPRTRLQSIGEARIAIERADADDAMAPLSASHGADATTRRTPLAFLVVAGLALAVGATAAWTLKKAPDPPMPLDARFDVVLPEGFTFSSNFNRIVTISPDSRSIAYTAEGLRIRPLNDTRSIRIPGSDQARSPAFSADSRQIAYWESGVVKRASIDAGTALVVAPLSERPMGMQWADDGYIYVGRADDGIWRAPGSGGTFEPVITLEKGEYAHGPEVLPGGDWIMFTLCRSVRGWSNASIVAQSRSTGERRVLIPHGREARYVRSGHLTYVDAGTLFAVPFDLDAMTVDGSPVAMDTDVHMSSEDETGAAGYDVSDAGVLVFAPPTGLGATGPARLLFLDSDGNETPLPIGVRPFGSATLSPDDRRVAAHINDAEGTHVWVLDVERRSAQRLTTVGRNTYPTWSADGSTIYFASDRDGDTDIWRRRTDLSGPEEKVLSADGAQIPTAASRDGQWLYCSWMTPGNSDIARISLQGDPTVEMLVEGPADESTGRPSADGRYMSFQSDETGRWDIHVIDIETRRRWLVSSDQAFFPFWTRDGKQIVYRIGSQKCVSLDVETSPEFSTSAPVVRFELDATRQVQLRDMTSDGRRALISAREPEDSDAETRPRIVVVLHWFEKVTERIGG